MLPPFLRPGDQIRILSPSGTINPVFIDGATAVLQSWGLEVSEGKFARGAYGRFGGTKEQRIADLQEALDDCGVKAILCSRGGYGLAQIIDSIDFGNFVQSPKWLIGFSDITVLHNAISKINFASIHAIMAKHLTELPANSEQVLSLKNTLFGKLPNYEVQPHELNRYGECNGKIIGGNLSVFSALRGTPFDLEYDGNILFIEDIAENPYHIDRMLQNLRMSGALAKLSGLIVGQFSDCEEDASMKQTISEIIFSAVGKHHYPVCFNFPAGHVDYNLSLIMGSMASLQVGHTGVLLRYDNF